MVVDNSKVENIELMFAKRNWFYLIISPLYYSIAVKLHDSISPRNMITVESNYEDKIVKTI